MARANRRLTRGARYGKYVDGPDPLAPPVDLAEALDAIGEDVMAGYSPERAMREFLRRGGKDQAGLDDLARRVAERRRELTQRHNLDRSLQEVKELLERAVLEERKQLARDVGMDDSERAFAEMQLDNLPPSPAAAVSQLSDYDWQSRAAREDYEKIKDLLGREMLDQRFAGMKSALENATDEDRAAINEMLDDLNTLLEAHQRGEDTQEQFDEFMAKHGEFFPENPRTIDELLDALAQRAAAAQRMRNSMTQEQRDELDALAQQAFGSPELMSSLARLDGNLQAARPGEDWGSAEQMDGEEGLGLGDGTGVFQDIADLDELSEQLSQSYNGSRMDDLDLDKLTRQLGDEAAVDARTLQRLEQALRDSGTLKRGSDGQLKLTPKAMRQLGKALLRDVANTMSGRQGNRDVRQAGAAGERSGATREWAFGDTEPWDVTRTITNAITRIAGEGGATDTGVQDRDRRRRGPGDRGPYAGVRRAARRHVVLDGDGRPLGADEAHGACAAHPHHEPLPRRRPAAHRVRPARRGHGHRAAHGARRDVRQGHQPAPRAAAGQPAFPQAPQRAAGAADRDGRRADVAPRVQRRGVLQLSATSGDRGVRRAGARQRGTTWRADDVLPPWRGPRPCSVHRPDGEARRRHGRGT